jgi:hypothetical protein
MVVNFRAHGISRGARKLARTPTLNLKKKKIGIRPTMLIDYTCPFKLKLVFDRRCFMLLHYYYFLKNINLKSIKIIFFLFFKFIFDINTSNNSKTPKKSFEICF